MAEICRGVVSDSDGSCEGSSRAARRRRMELRRDRVEPGAKRRRLELSSPSDYDCPSDYSGGSGDCGGKTGNGGESDPVPVDPALDFGYGQPKFWVSSVCGRRREMEDEVAIHPLLCRRDEGKLHYYGVYDGHGCTHVATRCKERLHEVVDEELLLDGGGGEICRWQSVMERSFSRMDKEVIAWNENDVVGDTRICRCELRTPQCEAVGSTAVVAIVTPQKIVVANCGDSRAVLCRGGKAIPLSTDHKPDRPDELERIQAAGGRVIFWEGARVLGVLAMSRAIGDNYLKPYVISQPEVTVMERREEDECLILGSDGLWDVVSNETACGVVRMCLLKGGDNTCIDAALLLTKLAMARRSTDNVSAVVIDLRKPM